MDLDDAYANATYIPNAETFPTKWMTEAAAFRKAMQAMGRARLAITYGDSDRQAYDLFLPESLPRGLVVFVHGGYWLRFHRTDWSHFAAGSVARGFAVAMPSYDLCPDVRIADITRQITAAIHHAAGAIEGPLLLTGHSAGGHLVSRVTQTGLLDAAVAARLAHVVPISPVADLRPLLQTSMNAQFRLDPSSAESESPVLQPAPDVPVTVWVGGNERPAFLDQARWLSQAWGAPMTVDPARHHFDVIDGLADPASALVSTLLMYSQADNGMGGTV